MGRTADKATGLASAGVGNLKQGGGKARDALKKTLDQA